MKFCDTIQGLVKAKASYYVITDVEGRRLCVAKRMCDLISSSKNYITSPDPPEGDRGEDYILYSVLQ